MILVVGTVKYHISIQLYYWVLFFVYFVYFVDHFCILLFCRRPANIPVLSLVHRLCLLLVLLYMVLLLCTILLYQRKNRQKDVHHHYVQIGRRKRDNRLLNINKADVNRPIVHWKVYNNILYNDMQQRWTVTCACTVLILLHNILYKTWWLSVCVIMQVT